MVASAAGLVSLSVTLFRGCIQALEFLEAASNLGRDADVVRCKLEWEQYRLYQWAERVSLENKPIDRLNWNLVVNTLKQLEVLLTSTQKLKERYHLDLVELDKLTMEEPAPPSRKTGFGSLLSRLRPDFPLASSRIIQENNTPAKKLRWAATDKEKVARLVNEIAYFNNHLYSLLEVSDQDSVKSALGTLLRDIISRSNVSSELDVVKQLLGTTNVATPSAVASAASLKQIRLTLGLCNANQPDASKTSAPSMGPKPKLKQLKPNQFRRQASHPPFERELARYKANLVLVEWRFVEKTSDPELKRRVERLAIFLGSLSDPSFHSLHCFGLLPQDKAYQAEDENYDCYGLVFQLALPVPESHSSSSPAIRSLSALYNGARKPSLNERSQIALAIAETILQLHTSGWLHKGIRSDNILFLDMGDFKWNAGKATGPYLAGYDFARPDHGQTEATPSRPELELYRHPHAQGPSGSNFRKTFDLFALGCVMLEIGLWTNLQTILEQASGRTDLPIDWAQINAAKTQLLYNDEKNENLANVSFHAGDTFKEVIMSCLYADDEEPDDEDLTIQEQIVDKLRACRY